jgi:hypothetical protein
MKFYVASNLGLVQGRQTFLQNGQIGKKKLVGPKQKQKKLGGPKSRLNNAW